MARANGLPKPTECSENRGVGCFNCAARPQHTSGARTCRARIARTMTELRRILDAVEVQPPAAFRCAGRTVEAKPGRLIESLKEFLYEHCYTREFDGSFREG